MRQLADVLLYSSTQILLWTFFEYFFFTIGRHDQVFRLTALMFRFDFLDQPANRGDPLSAGDRTGGINIEMNWFPSHYLSCCGKAGPYVLQQRGFVYSVGSNRRRLGQAHSRGLFRRQNSCACRCVRIERLLVTNVTIVKTSACNWKLF